MSAQPSGCPCDKCQRIERGQSNALLAATLLRTITDPSPIVVAALALLEAR